MQENPFQSPQFTGYVAPEATHQGVEYVGFWMRFLGFIVDAILMQIVAVPLLILVYGWGYFASPAFLEGPFDAFMTWIFPALVIVSFWTAYGATPGKMMIGARIVDAAKGHPISVAQAVVRYFASMLSGAILFLGYIWVAFHPRKQAWHDLLAGTVVVRPTSGHEALFPQARHLDDY